MAVLYTLLLVVASVSVFWLAGFWFVNELTIPSGRITGFRKALVIFPHADDEMNVGGLLWRLSQQGTAVTLVILTKGERGTSDAHLDPKLKVIRSEEAQASCKCLGVSQLIQKDFGDGR